MTEEHFEYLDKLKKSGITNMYGAAPYLLAEDFGIPVADARKILTAWMKTFDRTSTPAERLARVHGNADAVRL